MCGRTVEIFDENRPIAIEVQNLDNANQTSGAGIGNIISNRQLNHCHPLPLRHLQSTHGLQSCIRLLPSHHTYQTRDNHSAQSQYEFHHRRKGRLLQSYWKYNRKRQNGQPNHQGVSCRQTKLGTDKGECRKRNAYLSSFSWLSLIILYNIKERRSTRK
uniref:Uncharacterized protein n=1 Tax=Siphoviridae sp. ctnPP24 TaxID=2825662 RepID=A0A8S5TYX6_9CAUD|nr:MAG TPA: hypothetical protein [Siphoviridae sp. ctnPP24]